LRADDIKDVRKEIGDVRKDVAELKFEVKPVKWTVGLSMALSLALVLRLFFPSAFQ
jgi:hypothetical protein